MAEESVTSSCVSRDPSNLANSTMPVAVCCSVMRVLQGVVVCCSVSRGYRRIWKTRQCLLQCVAVCCSVCSVLQWVVVWVAETKEFGKLGNACCSVLQCVIVFALYCSGSQRKSQKANNLVNSAMPVAVSCSELQCVAVCYSVLQCVAVCCSALQCVVVWVRGSK